MPSFPNLKKLISNAALFLCNKNFSYPLRKLLQGLLSTILPMKYVSTILIVLYSFCSIAQNSFFVQANASGGLTGTTGKISYDNLDVVWAKPVAKIATVDGELLLGYQHNNWTFTIGISYLQTGYKEHYEYFEFWTTEVENTERFYHVLLPVTVSRKFRFNERSFFSPALGGAFSYNYALKETGKQNDENNVFHSYNNNISKAQFDYNFQRESIWGIIQATFGYVLNTRMDITAGPEVQYMITGIEKPTGAYNGHHQNMRNYALLLNAGAIWHFKKAEKQRSGK